VGCINQHTFHGGHLIVMHTNNQLDTFEQTSNWRDQDSEAALYMML